MTRRLALIGFGASCLLLAYKEPAQKIQVSKTEQIDFPSGGLLRLRNSIGEIWVEGWDRQEVMITTSKSSKAEYAPGNREKGTHELDQVLVTTERHGDEVVVTTVFPRHGILRPLRGSTSFDLEYRIFAPRHARLAIQHDVGDVFVNNMMGDTHVTARQGLITIRLPEEAQYNIDARSQFGTVTSAFPGQDRRKPWLVGEQFTQSGPTTGQKLYLRVGWGDITIMSERGPRADNLRDRALVGK